MQGITIAGAGPVGSLLAIFLARRGYNVTLLERRADMRQGTAGSGRSINLAVSARGLFALRQVGLEADILRQAVPMFGRHVHLLDGTTNFQRYGRDDSEYINSISRGDLNKTLMSAAEKNSVRIEFDTRLTGRDADAGTVTVCDESTGLNTRTLPAPTLIGTDGASSAVRRWMQNTGVCTSSENKLDYGYKEFTIPPGPNGSFLLEKNALHIWPRGAFMLIALPNFDGSFTCTLFLPYQGAASFAQLDTPAAAQAFFNEQFADAAALIPDLAETFFANPTGHMTTVKCAPWNVGTHTLLLGDAAHGIVPFFGQGMNCGFEDCSEFDAAMQATNNDLARVIARFGDVRRSNTDAIADMAVENFVEMRDKVGDPQFVFNKSVEKALVTAFPQTFLSRYAMVTFSRLPYRTALDAGQAADSIVAALSVDLKNAADVDLARAQTLINERFAPLLNPQQRVSNPWS